MAGSDTVFDRVLNPTLGWPQQLVLRIWRALKDDQIDLFSKEGLLDPAFIPIFGAAFSQRDAPVAQDFLGDDASALSQLGFYIGTDPLTLGSGGLTHLARGARASQRLVRTPAVIQAAAKAGIDDLAKVTPAVLRRVLQEAGDPAFHKGRLGRAVRALEGAPQLEKMPIGDLLKHTADREIFFSVPIVGKALGIRAGRESLIGYRSWFEVARAGTEGMASLAATLAGPITRLPAVRAILEPIAESARAFSEGAQAGKSAIFGFTLAPKDVMEKLALSPDLSAAVVTGHSKEAVRLHKHAHDAFRAWNQSIARGEGESVAFLRALGLPVSRDPARRAKALSTIQRRWNDLIDPTGQLGRDLPLPQTAAEMQDAIYGFLGSVDVARLSLDKSMTNIAGGFSDVARKRAKAYTLGQKLSQSMRRAFISDVPIEELEAYEAAYKQSRIGATQGAGELAANLTRQSARAAQEAGVSPKFFRQWAQAILEAEPNLDEITSHLGRSYGSVADAKDGLRALGSYLDNRLVADLESAKVEILGELSREGLSEGGHRFLTEVLADIEDAIKGSALVDEGTQFTANVAGYRSVPPLRSTPTVKGVTGEAFAHKLQSRAGGDQGVAVGLLNNQALEIKHARIKRILDGNYKLKPETKKAYEVDLREIERELAVRAEQGITERNAEYVKAQLARIEPIEVRPRRTVDLADGMIPEYQVMGEVSPLAESLVALKLKRDSMKRWVAQQIKDGRSGAEIPPHMLDELEGAMSTFYQEFRGIFTRRLGPEGQRYLDAWREGQRIVLSSAEKNGVLTPGSPVNFMARVLDGEATRGLNKLIGALPEDQVQKIAPTLAFAHRRKMDHMSLREVRALYTTLAEGDAPSRKVASEIKEFLSARGEDIDEVFTRDPTEALTVRLLELKNYESTEQFMGTLGNIKEARKAGLLQGRVVGAVDDYGNRLTIPKAVVSQLETAEGTKLARDFIEMGDNYKALVMELSDGSQTTIPVSVFNRKFVLAAYGKGLDNFGKTAATRLATSLPDLYNRTPTRSGLIDLIGQDVMFGPENVVSAINGVLGTQGKSGPWLIKAVHDPVHTTIKAMQTVLRIPFHVANLVSSAVQMSLLGVSPDNLVMGYWDAGRFLSVDRKLLGQYSKMQALTADAVTGKTGFAPSARTGRLSFENVRVSRLGGLIGDGTDIGGFRLADGQEIDLGVLLQKFREHGLFGTFGKEGLKYTSNVPNTLREIRRIVLAEAGEGTLRERGIQRVKGAVGALGESSELLARLSGVFAMLRQGADIDTAIKSVVSATVNYGDVTRFEAAVAKRASSYYTFARKFIPFAWEKFGENPARFASDLHLAFDSNFISTENGRVDINLGEYRYGLDRVMPQLMIPQLMANIADRLFDIRSTTPAGDVQDVFEPSGLLNIAGFESFLPKRPDGYPDHAWHHRALNLTWATKWVVDPGPAPDLNVTPLDQLARRVFGVRKTGKLTERRALAANYDRLLKEIRFKASRSRDPQVVAELHREAGELSASLNAILKSLP